MFKTIASKSGKAIAEFSMINEGDKILICFSGGKDSFVLIRVLSYLKRKYPINFELKIVCVNPNFDSTFFDKVERIAKNEDLDFEIINSKIGSIIEDLTAIKKMSPCFMCSRLRRGILYNYAIENGFNKIALGHTLNDAIETHLMNTFFSNKTSFLKPKYLAENGKVEVIRPMIFVDEKYILDYIKKENYIAVKNNCPMRSENSKREYFRKIICDLEKINPKIMESVYHAFRNTKDLNSWDKFER